jgi:hypothetical protein
MKISFVDGGVVQILEFYPSQSLGDDIDHIQKGFFRRGDKRLPLTSATPV